MPLRSQKHSEIGLLLYPFLEWGNQDSERRRYLLKIPGPPVCIAISMLCTYPEAVAHLAYPGEQHWALTQRVVKSGDALQLLCLWDTAFHSGHL